MDIALGLKSVEIRLLCFWEQATRLLDFLSNQVLLELALVSVTVL